MYKIRKASSQDAKSIAQVHVDSWRTTYKGIIPASYLDSLSYESRENLWQSNLEKDEVFVAEAADGKIVGFATGGPSRMREHPRYKGELYALYILKEYQGKGIGRALIRTVSQFLEKNGCSNMLVLVLQDNPACHFYRSMGGVPIATLEIEIAGKTLEEVVYGWLHYPDKLNKFYE